MNRVGKAISQVLKSFRTVKKDLTFVYDLEALNSSFELDRNDSKVQADIEKTKKSLLRRRESIKQGIDVILKKIDAALQALENI